MLARYGELSVASAQPARPAAGARFARSRVGCVVAAVVFAPIAPALAHHSIVPFDTTTFIELEGEISEVSWRNPHVRLKMRVRNAAGTTEEWDLEGDSANASVRRGLTRESINVGDRVRIAGNPSSRGRRELLATNILFANGVERLMTERPRPWRWSEAPAEVAPSDTGLGRSLFRVWSFAQAHRPREPFVFTPAAQAARAAWNPFTDMLALRCVAPGMPNAMLNPYPIEFIDTGERIRLRIEQWEAVRLIDMVSEAIPADAPTGPYGYSIGRWEGASLVVETAGIDFPYLDDAGTPLSGAARITERFTVGEDGNRLDYEVTVTDPPNLVEPAVEDAAWQWIPGTRIRPYECEPEAID